MSPQQATIDGRRVDAREGETILAAARRAGIDLPTLCYVEGCEPEGSCRVCLVRVEGARRPAAACHTPLEPDMTVTTSSPELTRLRRGVLELLVEAHHEADFFAEPTELQALLTAVGVERPAWPLPTSAGVDGVIDKTHPYMRFDPRLCVTCRRCLRVCEDVQGQFVFGIGGMGAANRLLRGSSESFLESDCTACGACVDVCPTGALFDVDRETETNGRPQRTTRSTCGYCGVGCQVDVVSEPDRVVRISGARGAAVNDGHLCAKGRYAHSYQSSHDRLKRPLLREGESWREIGWDEALSLAAEHLTRIRISHGPEALGVFTSSRSTNEAAYLFQKLFRTALGTNNVDCCARVCHSSTALALRQVTGTGAASASFADIERAACIVVAGANPTEAHPVVGARIRQAALSGARLIVIDPRRIELVHHADAHLAVRPGTNVSLFNALAKVLVEERLVDEVYVEARTEGYAELAAFLRELSLEELAEISRVDAEAVRSTARLIGSAGPVLFVHGLVLSELTQGTASVRSLCNLGMLTGSIGRPGGGMLPLRGQNNVQGNADMGATPELVTGYQSVEDPDVRTRVARIWGTSPPPTPGKTRIEMLSAARRGEIRSLWIQGEDVVRSDPDEQEVVAALEALEFLVVQELFLSATARYAHLVLPAAGALEQEGTFTNGERRIQLVRRAVAPPGEARPDWEVARDLGRALGQDWTYGSSAEVLREVARVAPHLFGGVDPDRLAGDGLQWPCPSPEHPGTEAVHAAGFLRGKGRLSVNCYEPSPEHDVADFPYLLNTGRALHHYNVGTMTRRTRQSELMPLEALEIHRDDAEGEGLADGDDVDVESRWGRTRVPIRISDRVRRGELFLSFHFPESHTNRLTGPHLDPESKCPQYKAVAVRLRS